nr:MAG TPA: hypothetical protein [Caudoviricetes sp.]
MKGRMDIAINSSTILTKISPISGNRGRMVHHFFLHVLNLFRFFMEISGRRTKKDFHAFQSKIIY